MTETNDFLDASYEIPQGPSNYTKLATGVNRLRILSKALIGWEYFNNDNKPVRIEGVEKPIVEKSIIKIDKYGKQEMKHFWAMLVWNCDVKQMQVFTVTQKSIQTRIQELSKSKDWGSPFAYDIEISKTGSGKEVEYSTTPIPPKLLSEEAKAAYKAKPCNLKELLSGGDPFASSQPFVSASAPDPVKKDPVASVSQEDGLPF